MVKNTSGGSASSGGSEYQASVASWFMCQMLAGEAMSSHFDLPEDSYFTNIELETGKSTDDLLVWTSYEGRLYVQAKRSISISDKGESEFAKTINQFCEQYKSDEADGSFDAEHDRYLLIAEKITEDAIVSLDRHRAGVPIEIMTVKQQEAINKITDHIRRIWKGLTANTITEQQLNELLGVIYIRKLVLLSEGADKQHSKTLLKTAVVSDTKQADAAWTTLFTEGMQLARLRGSKSTKQLSLLLKKKGIGIQSSLDIRKDIARLNDYTKGTESNLIRSEYIQLSNEKLTIDRASTKELIHLALGSDSFVVVGDPGAGKSGAMSALIRVARKQKRDVVAIATDDINATSRGTLREELGLEHEITDILANWEGKDKGILIIDALDAARNPQTAALFIRIIEQVLSTEDNRWNVIVSIRKYDLRNNPSLRNLYAQKELTSTYKDNEFSIAHFNIPLLTTSELEQVKEKSESLGRLLEKAGANMFGLLTSPFNLNIAAEIISTGIDPSELTQINSQIELLNRYWDARVVAKDDDEQFRIEVLRETSKLMVDQQSLHANKQDIVDGQPSYNKYLKQLISSGVLQHDVGTEEISYAHHVLYDYIVARSLLLIKKQALKELIKANRFLALSIRPSLQFYWQYKWQQDTSRQIFWQQIIDLSKDPEIPSIVKLIAPEFAANAVKNDKDLAPLLEPLKQPDPETVLAAKEVLRYANFALAAVHKQPNNGAVLTPWLNAANVLLDTQNEYQVTLPIGHVIDRGIEDWTNLTLVAKKSLANAIVKLFNLEFDKEYPHSWLLRITIRAACLCLSIEPQKIETILRRMISKAEIKKSGYSYLHYLTNEEQIEELLQQNQDIVEDIYKAIFNHKESSNESTAMGSSRIMPMTSNRRQDYEMNYYSLARAYEKFIARYPELAAKIVINAVAFYSETHHKPESKYLRTDEFQTEYGNAKITEDYSYIWSSGGGTHDEPLQMLNKFGDYLKNISDSKDNQVLIAKILQIFVESNKLAVVWNTLIKAARKWPFKLQKLVTPLLFTPAMLSFSDTYHEAGELLRATYSQLDEPTRLNIENIILELPAKETERKKELLIEHQKRLVGLLDDSSIVTAEVKKLIESMKDTGAPPNDKGFSGTTWISEETTDEEIYKDKGIDVAKPENTTLYELTSSLDAIRKSQQGNVPSEKEYINNIEPKISSLFTYLRSPESKIADNKLVLEAWDNIADTCELISCGVYIKPGHPSWGLIKECLLEASTLSEPEFSEEEDKQYDENPFWGKPSPRAGAASGLVRLARFPDDPDSKIIDRVVDLSQDKVAAVRHNVIQNIHLLKHVHPAQTEQIFREIVSSEKNRSVSNAALNPLGDYRFTNSDTSVELLEILWNRYKNDAKAKDIQKNIATVLSITYTDQGSTEASRIIEQMLQKPSKYHVELTSILFALRSRLVLYDEDKIEIRRRSIELLRDLVNKVVPEYDDFKKKYADKNFSELPQEIRDEFKGLATVVDHVGTEIYFASGSFKGGNDPKDLGLVDKRIFIEEIGPIINSLAESGDARVTHHLIELAAEYVEADPVWSLTLTGNALENGLKDGAQFESLIVDKVIALVNRFIAEYRQLLRSTDNQKVILDVLDALVDAGWSQAIELTHNLDEIFR